MIHHAFFLRNIRPLLRISKLEQKHAMFLFIQKMPFRGEYFINSSEKSQGNLLWNFERGKGNDQPNQHNQHNHFSFKNSLESSINHDPFVRKRHCTKYLIHFSHHLDKLVSSLYFLYD